jgi:hypothetical protein
MMLYHYFSIMQKPDTVWENSDLEINCNSASKIILLDSGSRQVTHLLVARLSTRKIPVSAGEKLDKLLGGLRSTPLLTKGPRLVPMGDLQSSGHVRAHSICPRRHGVVTRGAWTDLQARATPASPQESSGEGRFPTQLQVLFWGSRWTSVLDDH